MRIRDKKYSVLYLLCLAALAGCATPAPTSIDTSTIPMQGKGYVMTAGSIWPGETSRNSFFQDLRARNVGDTVTVTIQEKTSATREATTSTSRVSSNDIAVKKLFGLPLKLGMSDLLGQGQPFSPEVASDYDSAFDGSGTTKRSGQFKASLTARVVEVLGNGNLVIEGKKDTILNNEHQYLVLSGIIRPEDLSVNNSVDSTLISDARIEYSGRGVISDEQSPGWMMRILDNVWPF
ncbi:MAG: flagellar basal body L-ring protein FlgH [Thermodesulfobacteriota bacterium]